MRGEIGKIILRVRAAFLVLGAGITDGLIPGRIPIVGFFNVDRKDLLGE
jgi:hypothetical protein